MAKRSRNGLCTMLAKAASAALVAMTGLYSQTAEAAATPRNPNIVVILADDLGYGDLGCYGSPVQTKNCDRLAKEGMRFTDAHAPAAVCSPTRYSVLTGRYCWRNGMACSVLGPESLLSIAQDRLTIQEMLKSRGYATGIFGKWHLGIGRTKADYNAPLVPGPVQTGFDQWFGMLNGHNIGPYVWAEGNGIFSLKPGQRIESNKDRPAPPCGRDDTEIHHVLADRVDKFIEANKDKPFFLYYPTPQIHYPLTPNEEFLGKGINAYAGFVLEMDWCVGRVMAKLDQLHLADNTLVIFSSDNGAYTGQKWPTNGALRGQKGSIYEGGHREPFIARWPGQIPASSTSDERVCLTDLFATCAAITGASLPAKAAEDSYNLLPALKGEKLAGPIREATVAVGKLSEKAFAKDNPNYYSITQGPWKLIGHASAFGISEIAADDSDDGPQSVEGKAAKPAGKAGNAKKDKPKKKDNKRTGDGPDGTFPPALYNLKDDLAEANDVARANPEVVKRLTKLMTQYAQQGYSRAGAQGKGGISSP